MGADGEVTGHPIVAKGHITNLVFGNPTSDEAWEGQIGYGPTRNLALGGLGAGGWTSGSRHL